jgi:DNA-binding NarL/FixJ family response regulator
MISVLVVSPVRIYRDGVADGLRATGRFEAAATTTTAAAAEAAARRPDVAVFDVATADGLIGVRAILSAVPSMRVVVLGVEQSEEDVIPWAEAGASGFVGRDASLVALARILDAAARGELLCSPSVAAALCDRLASLAELTGIPATAGLTRRERDIARLMETGLTNKEIAARLCIQSATVKNHVHSILAKLGARRRGEAASRIRALYPELLAAGAPAPARTRR